MEKTLIGWKEWCSLPDLSLPAVKAKIDTGAKTSCLHAFNIQYYRQDSKDMVKFQLHPVQYRKDIVYYANAECIDRRFVTDSGAHKELRYIIKTIISLGDKEKKITKEIELSLTNRIRMSYRMLIGREALTKDFIIDPDASFLLGRMNKIKNKTIT
jgi:ribosomal protein S6--L-glutamate ligase